MREDDPSTLPNLKISKKSGNFISYSLEVPLTYRNTIIQKHEYDVKGPSIRESKT